jgi:hypothetical protein
MSSAFDDRLPTAEDRLKIPIADARGRLPVKFSFQAAASAFASCGDESRITQKELVGQRKK